MPKSLNAKKAKTLTIQHSPTTPKSAAVFLLGTIADTTWRMFVPAIGATIIGVMSDKFFGTTPWLTVVGIILGSSLSVWLVIRQIKRIKRYQ